jgi:hypothetical protein
MPAADSFFATDYTNGTEKIQIVLIRTFFKKIITIAEIENKLNIFSVFPCLLWQSILSLSKGMLLPSNVFFFSV